MGNNVHFQPRKLPADPKFIILHNNICIAANVQFTTHDIIHKVFQHYDLEHEYESHLGCIEIMDNVFVGSGTIILPNVRIGPNAIVAAGSVVTKDVPEGVIVGGNPAKIIGRFDDLLVKRQIESEMIKETDRLLRVEEEWQRFYQQRD